MNSKITLSSENDNNFIDNKQEEENNERIVINFSIEEINKENILFYHLSNN